jgi:hypothetical protein
MVGEVGMVGWVGAAVGAGGPLEGRLGGSMQAVRSISSTKIRGSKRFISGGSFLDQFVPIVAEREKFVK